MRAIHSLGESYEAMYRAREKKRFFLSFFFFFFFFNDQVNRFAKRNNKMPTNKFPWFRFAELISLEVELSLLTLTASESITLTHSVNLWFQNNDVTKRRSKIFIELCCFFFHQGPKTNLLWCKCGNQIILLFTSDTSYWNNLL